MVQAVVMLCICAMQMFLKRLAISDVIVGNSPSIFINFIDAISLDIGVFK